MEYKVKSSPLVFVKSYIKWAILSLASLLFFTQTIPVILIIIIPLAIVRVWWLFLVANNMTYTVDDRYIQFSQGVFNKSLISIDLCKIKDVALLRPLFMRLFRLSHVAIIGGKKSIAIAGIPKGIAESIYKDVNLYAVDSYVELRTRKLNRDNL